MLAAEPQEHAPLVSTNQFLLPPKTTCLNDRTPIKGTKLNYDSS